MRTITAMAVGFLLILGAAGSLAEEASHEGHGSPPGAHQDMSPPSAGMGHQMGQHGTQMHGPSMQHGMGMHAVHEQMQAIHDHSRTMEGITDQKKLMQEMKEHMRMMDQMMEQMMENQMAAAPTKTPGN
jgi:choline dehydrogenase-like flavoprotein